MDNEQKKQSVCVRDVSILIELSQRKYMHEWKLVTIIDLEVPPQKLLMGALLLQI
jgi:hypothetical protein